LKEELSKGGIRERTFSKGGKQKRNFFQDFQSGGTCGKRYILFKKMFPLNLSTDPFHPTYKRYVNNKFTLFGLIDKMYKYDKISDVRERGL